MAVVVYLSSNTKVDRETSTVTNHERVGARKGETFYGMCHTISNTIHATLGTATDSRTIPDIWEQSWMSGSVSRYLGAILDSWDDPGE